MLDRLILIHPDTEMCDAFRSRFRELPNVEVFQGLYADMPSIDAFVTAANSYGMMTAGIDLAVVEEFGIQIMQRIQDRIIADYFGEQPVGTAFVIDTVGERYPFLVHAPTMRVPGGIAGTEKIYLATFGALCAIRHHNADPANRVIRRVALPAMGTGFGMVPFDEAARQMAIAYSHALHPPAVIDWDGVIARHRRIVFDGDARVVV